MIAPRPTDAPARSRLRRLVAYLDPAEPGYVDRMIRLGVAAALSVGCLLVALGTAAMATDAGREVAMRVATAAGYNEAALRIALDLVESHPGESWEQYRFAAMNLRRLGRHEESVVMYDRAIEELAAGAAPVPGGPATAGPGGSTAAPRREMWWPYSHRCFYGALLLRDLRLDLCDRSIELAPDEAHTAHDRRGVVRALAGDREGAVADFETAMAVWRELGGRDWRLPVRARWVDALRRGEDPITDAEIAAELQHY